MNTLLKYFNEYKEKHSDSSWCDEFINYFSSHEDEVNSIPGDQLPENIEDLLLSALRNCSQEFKIKHELMEGMEINKDLLDKYKDEFIKYFSTRTIILREQRNNKDILEFCIANDFMNLVNFFDTSIFTLELLNKYKDKMIPWVDNQINELDSRLDNCDIRDNIEFLFFYLDNNLIDSAKYIINKHPEFVTKDLITKYQSAFNELFKGSLRFFSNNYDVFEYCLSNGLLNEHDLLTFNKEFYNKELFDKYKDQFINAFTYSNASISNNIYTPDAFEFAIENGLRISSTIMAHPDVCSLDLLNKHKEEVIKFLQTNSNYVLRDLLNNGNVLSFAYQNHIEKVVNLFLKERLDLFSDELLIELKEAIKELIQREGLGKCITTLDTLKKCIKYDIVELKVDKEMGLYKLEYLYNINDEILNTIILDILQYDFDLKFLSRITIYSDIQQKILNLDKQALDVFYKVAKFLVNESSDLSAIVTSFLNNFAKYSYVLDSIDEKTFVRNTIDINLLTDDKIKNFLYILTTNCSYGITNVNDLKSENFNQKKKEFFESAKEKIEDYEIAKIKELIVLKQFGINYNAAVFIVDRYSYDYHDLKESGLDEEILNIIFGIKTIVESASKEKLIEMYRNTEQIHGNYQTFVDLELTIRKSYAKMYSDKLFKVDDRLKSTNRRFENVTYKGKKITFYEADGDFSMQIHALGAYRDFTRPDDFKEDWNRPKIAYHGICTSFINNSEIATARANHPILGFSNYEESALLLAGNYDLFSDYAINSFNTSAYSPYKILPPEVMINATRHNHNEMVIERCKKNGQGNSIYSLKRQPNYILYVVDSVENERNFDMSGGRFQETLQAAYDFDLPIVIVDRSKISKKEMEKANKLESEFKNTLDLETLNKLFLTYFNNNVGGRFFSDDEEYKKNNLFDNNSVINFYNRIIAYVMNEVTDNNKKTIILNKIIEILNKEIANYNVSHKAESQEKPFDFSEAIDKLNNLINSYTQETENTVEGGKYL